MTDETAEARSFNLSVARRAHERHARAIATAFAPLVALSADILKAVALLNGGAAAATLVLLAATLRLERALAHALVLPLAAFGFGLTVAAFATGWSYLAQEQHARALESRGLSWSEPYVTDTPASQEADRQGRRLRRLAFAAVLVGMASAVAGFGLAGAILWRLLR